MKNNRGVVFGLRKASQLLGLIFALLLVCVPVFSQGNQGRIMGAITDQTGGVVAGATVTVTDVARGTSRDLVTNEAGEYNAPNLTPGTYSVRAESKGFKAVEQKNVLLEVGKEIRVDLSLQPGEVSQTITITEAPPMVETTNATLGGTLSNQTINDLPLNGRNYINLLSLRPGVSVYAGGGAQTRSANGTRAGDIGYLLDGVRHDEVFMGESVLNAAIPAGDSSTSLPIDAIQEFNTEQNPKAEFGWKPGAIINAGLKSGTNALHGTAFAFGRETALDARNFFNIASTDPALNQTKNPIGLEQFGASLGGAIKKDKLFYFVNYEGQRYNVGDSLLAGAPATVSLGGKPTKSLVDACVAVGFVNVNALSAQIAGLNSDCSIKPANFTPGPNESLFPTNDGTNSAGVYIGMTSVNSQNNGVAKVDYHINDHHTLSGMYFHGVGGGSWHDNAWAVGAPGSSNSPWASALWGYDQVASGSWTWTPNSTLVNQLNVGYTSYHQTYDSLDANVNPLAYGMNTGVTDPQLFGFPLMGVNGNFLTTFRLGGNWPKHIGPDLGLQFSDTVSITRGKHSFKFGGEIDQSVAQSFITANGKGRIRFANLEAFLLGDVKGSGSKLLTGDPQTHIDRTTFASFLQDDWRVTRRLTVNLGLRYELPMVFTERDNKLGNFDPTSPTGLVQIGYGETSAYHGDHNNFSPRVGFAWDVRGDGKTVIRGGGSIMYESIPLITFVAVNNLLGLNQVPTGATQIFCSTTPCVTGSTQVSRLGPGSMGVVSDNLPGSVLTPGWQAQTPGCVAAAFSGTTNCATIFPQSIFNLQCGDGLTFTPAGQSTTVTDPSPCNMEAVDPNMRTPYIGTWTLTIQRAITNNMSLEVAYVGDHGTKLLGFANINQPPLGSCINGNNGDPTCIQTSRPFFNKFPYIAEVDRISNQDKSNYNGLQVTLTQRPAHGLSFLMGYTYAHSLDNASNNFNGITMPPDSTHPTSGLYSNSDFDVRHRFTLSTTYLIPGKDGMGQLLKGWQLNSVVTLQTGGPWGARDTSNDFSGTNQVNEVDSFGQFWNFSGNPNDFKSGPTPIPCFGDALCGNGTTIPQACIAAATQLGAGALDSLNNFIGGCYMKGNSVLIPPAQGTIGNAARNIFRDSGFKNWDVSVVKNFIFKERLTTQFRAEFFNVLNHPIFTNPNGPAGAGFDDPSSSNFGCGCNTPDQAAPNPVLGTGGARSIQLGLKLIF
jgi:hypothetical protein